MIKQLVTTVLGTKFERDVRNVQPIVDEIHRYEQELETYSEEQLKAQTEEFRARILERTQDLEGELSGLREQKKHTESASDREGMALRIGQL